MAGARGSDALEAAQVRICTPAGEVVGAGFLVAVDVVCTCAHVVARAFGESHDVEQAPGTPVSLDFPLLPGRPGTRASVVSWRRGGADVALLRLEAAVEDARPVPLVDGTDLWGHTFRAFGYPAGADLGMWAWGLLRAKEGSGWLQMEVPEPGPRIVQGFSGSPVWDDAEQGVVGMTVAAYRRAGTAYLLPSAELIDERALDEPRCPFQGLKAFTQNDAEFFHGRDSETSRVHDAVHRRPVTLVAGPSGCGKSSLVRAGVLPRLRADGMSVTRLRALPGTRASAVLARTLTGLVEPELDEVERLVRAEQLADLLDARHDVLAELRSRILARADGAGHVLFVDQLEEYAGAMPEEARDLFTLLVSLAGEDGAAVLKVVATARPDSLDVLVTADTSDLVSDAVQFVAPLAAADLERAITAPVDAVRGFRFEPGLPKRIVEDAGDEPGRMPLVQFALTELWKHRDRSMLTLTHEAYDELGGVAGALVGYADGKLDRLTPVQRRRARRLFVQLARPGDGVAFSRRPARTADLPSELLGMARLLAPSKLIVLSRTPGTEGEEIVDLAHEALTEHWPLLKDWLVDSRDFRAWQEQLRTDLQRWQDQSRQPTHLLSGTDLVEAERRTIEHPEDISADERDYVLLSRRHSRRGTRLRRAAVASLAVLTVLAVALAFTNWQSLKRSERQLRTQASGLLAQAAEGRPDSDPATALQLALAAWNARRTATTRQALLDQYVRDQYLLAGYPSVWKGRVTGMDATVDGRTLVVRSEPPSGDRSTITVVTGALDGRPATRELSGVPEGDLVTGLSPNGHFFAASAGNGVRLWRLGGTEPPTVLTLGDHEAPEKPAVALDFSSDGTRLLLAVSDRSDECYRDDRRCTRTFAEAWRLPSGERLDVPAGLVPETGLREAAFTSDANTVVTIGRKDDVQRVDVRDFTTGRLRSTFTTQDGGVTAELRAGGEVLARTDVTRPYVQELGRSPGRKTGLPTAGSAEDATSRYGVAGAADMYTSELSEKGGYAEPTLTDLRTGDTYRTRIPTSGSTSASYAGVAAVPRADGGLTVLVPVGTALMVVRGERVGSEAFQDSSGTAVYAMSPDGRFVAQVTQRRLEVLDASRTHRRAVSLPAPEDFGHWKLTWTADSRRIVVWHENGGLYRAYSVRDLGESVPLGDAVPTAKEVDSVAGTQGSEVVLLTEEGEIARVDAADAAVRTGPFPADSGPRATGSADFLVKSQLVPRPAHPGQVAVVTKGGSGRGEILLWDVPAARRIAALSGQAVSLPLDMDAGLGAIAFDADGSHLAVRNSDGRVRVWDVDRGKQLPRSAPVSAGDALIGFGPDDSVLTYDTAKEQVRIHDLAGDGASSTLVVAVGPATSGWSTGSVHGHRLTVDTGAVRQTFDLRPDGQFRTLCAAAGRDYTRAERELLPEGTPARPPCS
ncbi:trypsin-like peptidase domain-containing protein [Streptomyces sp. NPDC060275]|uniref:nSTAND1 domain-containing NTPase n=1 Tax=Streptomyces sp. NPDC060275 TaxID=3347090 RepID=UPI003653DB6E